MPPELSTREMLQFCVCRPEREEARASRRVARLLAKGVVRCKAGTHRGGSSDAAEETALPPASAIPARVAGSSDRGV